MSFNLVPDIPIITWRDMHVMNALVKSRDRDQETQGARPLENARPYHRKCVERYLIGVLKQSDFVVLSAIVSRTFGWGKAIEAIPLKIFTDGMGDADTWLAGDDAVPYFAGTNLNVSTVRKALTSLAEKHLIERFQVLGSERNTHLYMPVSAVTLHYMLNNKIEWNKVPKSIDALAEVKREWGEYEFVVTQPLFPRASATAQEAA